LVTGGFALPAQTSTGILRTIWLNVVATDSGRHPVTDLAAADFAVRDEGSAQRSAGVRLNPGGHGSN